MDAEGRSPARLYETFFSGVERQPPNAPRRELNRLMLETQQMQIRNAALRFRFQSLSQRWILMTTYWNRTLREIEAGTYRKDVAKVSRRLAQKGAPLTEQEAVALGIPASRARALVARQIVRGGPGPAAAPPLAGPDEPRPTAAPSTGSRRRFHAPAASPASPRTTCPRYTAATTRWRAPPIGQRPRWISCATAWPSTCPR